MNTIEIFNKALVKHNQLEVKAMPKLLSNKLGDIVMQEYTPTSLTLLTVTHRTITTLLPVKDRECLSGAKLAIAHATEWRPLKVCAILLCELHKHTPEEAALHGP